jgi:hypothetical protein
MAGACGGLFGSPNIVKGSLVAARDGTLDDIGRGCTAVLSAGLGWYSRLC